MSSSATAARLCIVTVLPPSTELPPIVISALSSFRVSLPDIAISVAANVVLPDTVNSPPPPVIVVTSSANRILLLPS